MKLKRRVIHTKYKDQVDAMYGPARGPPVDADHNGSGAEQARGLFAVRSAACLAESTASVKSRVASRLLGSPVRVASVASRSTTRGSTLSR